MRSQRSPADRFWSKVQPSDCGCWMWLAAISKDGYGVFTPHYRKSPQRAHRFAYEYSVGPIPAGLQIDHLCRTRACVNPAHLEPVTNRENVLRGQNPTSIRHRSGVCKRGHALIAENIYIDRTGHRHCKPCALARQRERIRRQGGSRVSTRANRQRRARWQMEETK